MFRKLLGIDKLIARIDKVEAENIKLKQQIEEAENAKTPKEIATENNEPYVDVVKTAFDDPEKPGAGYFELDWNAQFVKILIDAGYSGRGDEEVVDMWFNDLCRGVVGDKLE